MHMSTASKIGSAVAASATLIGVAAGPASANIGNTDTYGGCTIYENQGHYLDGTNRSFASGYAVASGTCRGTQARVNYGDAKGTVTTSWVIDENSAGDYNAIALGPNDQQVFWGEYIVKVPSGWSGVYHRDGQ